MPRLLGLFLVVTVTAPPLLVVALAVDVARWLTRRRPFMALRLVAFLWIFLAVESAGVVAAGVLWLVTAGGRLVSEDRWLEWHFGVQRWWANRLFSGVCRVFDLRLVVEGAECAAPGPVIVLMRHASIIDNLLPAIIIANPNRLRLRYVLKRELLSDAALDIVGNRIPNHFVDRDAGSAEELERVAALGRGLGPRDGVLIYPEGTRFTEAKRNRALDRIAANDPDAHERASRLRHVLPPRPAGTLAVLETADAADVVMVAHHGLGGFAHVADLWAGSMVDRDITVKLWRVPRSEIPVDRPGRLQWLLDQWDEVDRWIEQRSVDAEAAA